MFECHVCGNKTAQADLVTEVFTIEQRTVLVERVPAQVCHRCGEPTFSRETAETIRRMLHGEARPIRTVPLEVFALA